MSHLSRRSLLAGGLSLAAASPIHAQESEPESGATPTAELGRTAHTRFAVNVEMWWTGLPFMQRIRQAAAFGFPAIEFWPWHNKDVDAVAELCRELKLEVAQFTAWGFSPGLNDPANHPQFVETIEASCEVARRLGARCMTVVGGNDRAGISQGEMHEHITSGLRLAAPLAEKHDVTLILEPMNIRVDHAGHCLYGSPPTLAICRAVDSSHVKINWDLYHMQITEGDLCGRMREGIDSIGYLQLADHPGRDEPGTGEIHYPRVLREAFELGYRGFVGLECRPSEGELKAARRVAEADRW